MLNSQSSNLLRVVNQFATWPGAGLAGGASELACLRGLTQPCVTLLAAFPTFLKLCSDLCARLGRGEQLLGLGSPVAFVNLPCSPWSTASHLLCLRWQGTLLVRWR